jgi:hexosaminidase
LPEHPRPAENVRDGAACAHEPTAAALPPLLPWPRRVAAGSGSLPASGTFAVEWLAHRDAWIERAVARCEQDVARRVHGSGTGAAPLRLQIDCRGDDSGALTIDAREQYTLQIAADAVSLTADGPMGVLRGLATLRQCVVAAGGGFVLPAMTVDDAPRFAWRGVMLDVARHFFSLSAVLRQVDAMERVKLNVLHLHLSDDEAFRVESRRYPKLHALATDGFYSHDDVRHLVAYAAERGVRVVPELDVPGHARVILRAYPELAPRAADGAAHATNASTLDPSNEATFAFLDGLVAEWAELFPDRCLHVGGDEVSGADWSGSPAVRAWMARRGFAIAAQVEAFFFDRVRTIAGRHGKTAIGWEEVARHASQGGVLVQTWRSSAANARATARGHRVIATCGYYLDKLWPADAYYRVDPHDATACGLTRAQLAAARAARLPPGLAGADQLLDPTLVLDAAQQQLVVGGEAALWSELVTEDMLDGRLWPAAAAIAERLWSPRDVRDPADMQRRLLDVHGALRAGGLADEHDRRRMAERLGPGDPHAVLALLDAVTPVRNDAHHQALRARVRGEPAHAPALDALADAAVADPPVARGFELDVGRLLRGERAVAAALRATLARWRDHHERFAAAARQEPRLEAALPVSRDVAALAEVGLVALGAIQDGVAPQTSWLAAARALVDRHERAAAASADIVAAMTLPQPPADLLVAVAAAVRALVGAAARVGD